MKRFLFWLTGYLPVKLIFEEARGDTPRRLYLERYFLFKLFGVVYYLHRFVGSDPDRAKHNHPWRWALSLLFSGWYMEENSYGISPVRWYNLLTGDTFHRVILTDNCPQVWTLFIHPFKKEKSWGFAETLESSSPMYPENSYVFISHISSPEQEWWLTAPKGKYSERLDATLKTQQSPAGQPQIT